MSTAGPVRQRRDARSNRARILEVAQTVLADNPDASMEDVAAAAGVVRRTVYAHFANRDALVEGLATEAANSIAEVMAANTFDADDPLSSMTRRCLALADVGERYRLLIRVARAHLGEGGIHDFLAPMRAQATDQIAKGQSSGHFSRALDAEVLATAVEAVALGLLEAANTGLVDDTGGAIAYTSLALLGVDADTSSDLVARLRAES